MSHVLRPKLRPPRLQPDRLDRPRLLAQLDQGLAAQSTLVAAPAGYGKTTLLSQWIGRQHFPVAWLTLDETDGDLSVFLEDLIAAVRTARPGSCRSLHSLLARPALPAVDLLIREIADELDELDEFILILEDCDNLKDPRILEILRYLICHPPLPVHLVLSSRADPRLPLGLLRGRGLLNEVRAADLRFSEQEAVDFLGRALGRPLGKDQVTSLLERTEGWIAGLHLAALSLRGREDLAIAARIQKFAGSDRYVSDYLMEELLGRLDPGLQRYLMATSILERLHAPLCQTVLNGNGTSTNTVDGKPVLEWLESANLFVFSLDDQREWFRYHHLFRDLLRHWLDATSSEEDVAALHVRAGEWLEANGRVDEALGHFLKAQRADLAAGAIEAHRLDALSQELWGRLERWVRRLGPAIVDSSPRLLLVHAWLAHERTNMEEMARYCDRAEQLLDLHQPAFEDDAVLRGEIAAMRAQTAFWLADGESAVAHARQALTLLLPDHRVARATAVVFEGAGLHLLGRNQEALDVLRTGSFGTYGSGIHPRAMVGLVSLAFITGELDYAAHVAARMLSSATELGFRESAGWAHFFLGLAAYLRSHLPAAEDHFAAIDPYASHVVPAKQAFYGLAWVRHAQGRTDEAVEVMDRCLSYITDLNLSLGSEARLLRARLAALSGQSDDAVDLARSLLPAAGHEPLPLHVCYEFSPVSAIAIVLLEGSDRELMVCEAALQRLLGTAETNGSVFRSIQFLILQAIVLDQQCRTFESVTALSRAAALAKHGGLIRLFPEMGDQVLPLLKSLRVRGRTDPFLEDLIASFAPTGIASSSSPAVRGPAASRDCSSECLLSNRELDVLALLEQRLSNKEVARRLVISPATVKRHTLSIYSKLGVPGRREAVVRGRQLGLLPSLR